MDVRTVDDRGRDTRVITVAGELDLSTADQLDHALSAPVGRLGTIDLDLGNVSFCDCAGLDVLIAARRRLDAVGGSLRIVRASDPVRRLVELTNTRWLTAA